MKVELRLPAWRGGNVLRLLADTAADMSRYTRFGVVFDAEPDEDAVTYLAQVVGYAWPGNMAGVPKIEEGRVSVHDDTIVVFDARIRLRRNGTRAEVQATRDLASQVEEYYSVGSPVRKNGTRLVNRPTDVTLPAIVGFMVG